MYVSNDMSFQPFVDICLEYGNQVEARKYVPKVSNELKVKYFVKLNMIEQAIQQAYEQKDLDLLLYVKSNSGTQDEVLLEKLNTYIAQLSKKSKIFWSN